MTAELKVIMDEINKAWDALEQALQGPEFKFDNCPLSMTRVNNRMRICFNGKPIAECKADIKAEAANHLQHFKQLIDAHSDIRTSKAKTAATLLKEFINELHSPVQAGSG